MDNLGLDSLLRGESRVVDNLRGVDSRLVVDSRAVDNRLGVDNREQHLLDRNRALGELDRRVDSRAVLLVANSCLDFTWYFMKFGLI